MYCKSTLSNGIRVVSEEIPYVKSVTLGIWVGTGSRSEQTHNHGVSHFIEHLMFKGTKKRSAKDIAEIVDAVGGQLNAFTAKEHTCYYLKIVDSHLELALDILSDMLLESKFDSADIEKEREVVLEELNMYEDSPDDLVHDIHLGKVWPTHPLGRNIIGTSETIQSFNQNAVREYYEQFYRPDNIVIAAAGNLSHERLLQLCQQYFGNLSGEKYKGTASAPILNPSQSIQTKDIEQVHICLGAGGVPQLSPDIYTLHVLNNLLGGGISSRLFQAIREERGLAYSVYSYQTNYSDSGLLTVYAGTRAVNVDQVVGLILENICELKLNGFSEKEILKSKEQLKGNLLLGLESSSSRMSRLGKMEITLGKYVSLDEVVSKIDKVTIEDTNKMIHRIFDSKALCFTALGPIEKINTPLIF